MDVNIGNAEVQDVENHDSVEAATEAPAGAEEVGEHPGVPEVGEDPGAGDGDSSTGVEDVPGATSGTDAETVVETVVDTAYDYTDVVFSEYTDINCETGTKTDHFAQVTVGIKVNDDGTTEAVDLGNTPEVYADEFPATADELSGAGCAPAQEAVAQVETVASAPVRQPEVLAETGLSGVAVPAALGAVILIVIGGMLVMNGISKRIGRKNK